MNKGDLQFINDKVLPSGVNVYSECDLPGYEDYYVNKHDDFVPMMDTIFGIKPETVNAYQDTVTTYNVAMSKYSTVELQPTQTMLPMRAFQSTWFGVWKYHKVMVTSGHTLVNMLLQRENNLLVPGIVEKKHEKAKAIISTFSLGDTNCEKLQCWTNHYMYYKGLFLTDKGLNMQSDISVEGSAMVQSYLIDTFDDMKILYIHNWDDYSTTQNVKFTMPSIVGMTIKDLLDNRRVYSASSNGDLIINLGPNDLRIFLINEPLKPFVQFVYDKTNVDLVPDLKGTEVAIKFDTSTTPAGQRCVLKVELLSEDDNKVYAKGATYVNGIGWTKTTLKLTDYSIKNSLYLSSSQGQHYYYRASIKCPNFDTQSSTLNVLLSWPVQPKTLPTSVQANQPVGTMIQWENLLPISRLGAFQGVVAVWNSSKTALVDPSHYGKVQRVADLLESIGYTHSRMVAWDEGLQDYGPLYHVFNDTVPNDPTGKGDLSVKYFADLIRFIVLPGVSVLSDREANNLNIWAKSDNFTDMAIVSTEGCPGRWDEKGNEKPDRMNWIFGTNGVVKPTSLDSKLVISNENHPTTYSVGAKTFDVKSGSLLSTGVSGPYVSAQGSLTQSDGSSVPAMIVNQLSDRTKAMIFNFDATDDGSSKNLNLKALWSGVSKWMHTNSGIYKMRWEAKCRNESIGSTETWITAGTGSQVVQLTPSESCSDKDLQFYGLMYYWNDTDPWQPSQNKGYFTSDNDDFEFTEVASSAGSLKQWCSMLIVVIVTVLLF
ncbi:hypothetical protein AKO1_015620 [Acrasis kona]|uniref:Uncharacterized protein n=1 Tax=Acrasis kona TaxID=1008807 RepID=A0AAW2ZGL5_9EUKA